MWINSRVIDALAGLRLEKSLTRDQPLCITSSYSAIFLVDTCFSSFWCKHPLATRDADEQPWGAGARQDWVWSCWDLWFSAGEVVDCSIQAICLTDLQVGFNIKCKNEGTGGLTWQRCCIEEGTKCGKRPRFTTWCTFKPEIQNFSFLHRVLRHNVFDRYLIYTIVWCREHVTPPDISKERNTGAVLPNGFGSNNCQKFTDNSQTQSKYSAWHCFLPRKKWLHIQPVNVQLSDLSTCRMTLRKHKGGTVNELRVTHSGIERELGVEQLLLKQEVRLWWTITE